MRFIPLFLLSKAKVQDNQIKKRHSPIAPRQLTGKGVGMNQDNLHSIQALKQANASEHLTDREKHLVGLAVTLTRGCSYCSGGRIEKARVAGISQETMEATVDLTAAVNAGVAVRIALLGIEGKDSAKGACDDETCSA